MKHSKAIIILLGILVSVASLAQDQTVKGIILDAQAEYPLIGATIQLVGSDPIQGSVADVNGEFRIENVPVGRQTFAVTYIGYKSISLPNVLVTSGKEVILRVLLEESVEKLQEVVVTANADKDLPLNDLAKVSARTFSLEEVTRFSGGRNDVARLATSFAGVSSANDARNDIVVRGNSPTGLLWRIEGIPVPTTNHFATLGTTGGPVNALNTNVLRTSDFLTGAFPAEYGNANSSVFDINFRNGNSEKYEFTGQLSAFSGLEAMAEGPFNKSKDGSFLISYRYGIASLAATGTSAVPIYQDLSFKLNFGKSKLGRFELFGFGGLSSIDFLGDEIEDGDLFANPNEDAFSDNELALVGMSHMINVNKTTYIKTSIGASTTYSGFIQDNFSRNPDGSQFNKYRATEVENRENRYTITSTLNKKFNARWNMRAGFMNETYALNSIVNDADNRPEDLDDNDDGIPDRLFPLRDVDETYNLTQFYGQVENNITDELSVTGGLHYQYLELSGNSFIEPRAAISYNFKPNQTISLAYGLHSQVAPGPVLFLNEEVSPDVFEQTNRDLDFIKSHHFVLGYDRNLGTDWRIKAEAYYQSLYDVPVEQTPSSYSVINEGADFVFDEKPGLVNEGSGKNYGMELTLEKFFSRGYYLLMTTSVFESLYEGSDGIERGSAFNTNFVYNALFGKEWAFGKGGKNAWTFDTRFTTSGGRPYTPIDLDATIMNNGSEVFLEDEAFSRNLSAYTRLDLKIGMRINSAKTNVSHQFFIDFQNVLNRTNEFTRSYNEVTGRVDVVEQNGFFPDVMYRIRF